MKNYGKEICYEYFDCRAVDCARRKYPDMNCWDVDEVECKSHSNEFEELKKLFGTKLEACKLCIYYQSNN